MRFTPEEKKGQLTIRVDPDVLKWLRSKGRGYQTKLNRLLRYLMLADQASKKAS
ncbi:MAG: BrnA antitoxin family protein [Terriglobales bacterium]